MQLGYKQICAISQRKGAHRMDDNKAYFGSDSDSDTINILDIVNQPENS